MNQEQLEYYLDGEMTAEEQKAFEANLNNDKAMSERLNLSKEINKAIAQEDVIELRRNLREILRENKKQGMMIRPRTMQRSTLFAVASVAILITAASFVMTLIITNGYNADPYSDFYKTEKVNYGVRGINDGPEIHKAYILYNEGRYNEAIPLLKQIASENNADFMAIFYLAMSELETQKYDQAISHFATIIKDGNNLYTEKAEWFSAHAYIRSGENLKAEKILLRIAKSEDHYYQKDAEKLLRKMK